MRNELRQHRVLHADETPVSMRKPGNGKTHRAYLWAYATGTFENTKVVVYDFCESRSGEHARRFLGDWRGSLTCDDFSGYVTARDMWPSPGARCCSPRRFALASST